MENKSVIIEGQSYKWGLGLKILKSSKKLEDFTATRMKEVLTPIWDSIEDLTFKEISMLENIEQRRVALKYFSLERLQKEIEPELVSREDIPKTTTWITEDGEMETFEYIDEYRLYKVKSEVLFGKQQTSWGRRPDFHYVDFKDTSTDRRYMIWVDLPSVINTNNIKESECNAIHAIAWTITTNVPYGEIIEIIRQGDSIQIKTNSSERLSEPRHLTGEEYLKYLTIES